MKPIFPESPQDWINAKPSKIYYNSRNKTYTSTILADEQVIADQDLTEKSKEYFPSFIENVLLNLNKKTDTIDSLVNSVSLEDTYIDASPLVRQKLLVAISEDLLENIEELPDIDISEYQTVRYRLSDFFSKITDVAKKFVDYQTEMVSDIYRSSNINIISVDFLMESEALYRISSNISTLIESNNKDISKYSSIEISYDSEYSIQCIKMIGGIDSETLKFIFQEFRNDYPQDRKQTTLFLYNLPSLNEEIKSNFTTYESIILKYMTPLSTRKSDPASISERSSQRGRSFSVQNKDITNKFDSLEKISRKSVGILQKEILNSVYRTPCMTPEERDRINEKLEKESLKRANLANKLSFSVSDAFFENLPEVLQKIADEQGMDAFNALGKNLLNRLGVCGIGDLTSLTLNTVFAYLDEQEYADELSKCAVRNLNNDKLKTLWKELQRFNNNTEILERYQKFVGDTIPPWNTAGYVPPDYRKDLDSDDPISEKYTLKIKTGQEDTDIDFRFTAFKNSVAASIKGEDLLNILVNTFPDEMGWLSFFTEMTKGIINKCKVPLPNVGVSFESNWCQKRVNLPELEDIPKTNASFTFRPSMISTILVEELKNVIINLTVRTVIASMRQAFQVIAAGTSFDSDYFKQNQYIPDLFQAENDVQSRIAEFCNDTSQNYRKTNEAVRQAIYDTSPPQQSDKGLSLEDIDSFLKSSSVSLSRYDKIRLYLGEAEETTYEKVLSLISGSIISDYLKNYGDIEQSFLGIGNLLDVDAYEQNFYDNIRQPPPISLEYCGEGDDDLSSGYLQNKPNITQEQIERMKEVLKNVQKDKICFAAETLGNPNGVIIGQLGEMFKSKTGPIFERISDVMVELFKPDIERKMDTVSKNYRNDLYSSKGLFDLIMVDAAGIGKNRRDLSSFFNPLAEVEDVQPLSMLGTKLIGSSYNPRKGSANIILGFENKSVEAYSDPSSESTEFDTGAEKIRTLLIKNQSILRDNLNNKISENFIRQGVLTEIVDLYFDDMINKLSSRTYRGWGSIYEKVQEGEDKIPKLLAEDDIIENAEKLYKSMEPFDETDKYVPFNAIKSKEEAVLCYASFSTLINTVSSEVLLKSLPIYEAFGSGLLREYELLGNHIYKKILKTIDNYTTDNGRSKLLEKLVQITLISSNEGIIPSIPSDLLPNVDRINKNITSWIGGSRGNKVKNLEKNIKAMEEVVEFFVKEASLKYIREFQEAMAVIEKNTFPSINKTDTIYKYIFNESVLSSAQNVITNPDSVGILTKGLRLEKYIILKDAKTGILSGVQNLNDFRQYLIDNPQISGNISDNWSSWSFGIRISSVYDLSKSGVSIGEINLETRNEIKAFTLLSDSNSETPEKYFLSPIVVYEEEIPDQPISGNIINAYSEDSMKKGLSEISDFLNFYYRGVNIENLMSLVTIYIDEEFGEFLTDNGTVIGNTVRNWKGQGEKILNDTKRFTVNTLERI